MSAAVTDRITIAAEPDTVMAVITDIEAYPQWQDEVTDAEVLETDDAGRPVRARMTVDAKILTTTYTLRYDYTDDALSWELEEGDQLSELTGAYRLADRGDGTTEVTYELTVEPRIRVPGMVRRQAAKRVADGALKGLRRRVETGA